MANLDAAFLFELEEIIGKRKAEMPEGSYTTYLFTEGVDKILKKVGEESAEVIIAAKNRDAEELKWESADLLYHLLVLLQEQELPLQEVLTVLKERHAVQKKKKNIKFTLNVKAGNHTLIPAFLFLQNKNDSSKNDKNDRLVS